MKYKIYLVKVLLVTLVISIAIGAKADTTEIIFSEFRSPAPTEREWKFNVTPFSIEHQVRLSLDARVDWPSLAGSNPWLRVSINGNFLTKENLLNKRNDFKLQNGMDLTWVTGDKWRVLYSPDFEAAINAKDDSMATPVVDPYHFVWDITQLVKPGWSDANAVSSTQGIDVPIATMKSRFPSVPAREPSRRVGRSRPSKRCWSLLD